MHSGVIRSSSQVLDMSYFFWASACNTSSSLRRLTSTKTSSAKWNDKCHTSLPCLTRIWFQKIFKVVMMFWNPKINMFKCPQKDVTNEHLQRCRMVHLELIHYEALQLIPETRGDFRPVFFLRSTIGKNIGTIFWDSINWRDGIADIYNLWINWDNWENILIMEIHGIYSESTLCEGFRHDSISVATVRFSTLKKWHLPWPTVHFTLRSLRPSASPAMDNNG